MVDHRQQRVPPFEPGRREIVIGLALLLTAGGFLLVRADGPRTVRAEAAPEQVTVPATPASETEGEAAARPQEAGADR